jgi:hypothetical protein
MSVSQGDVCADEGDDAYDDELEERCWLAARGQKLAIYGILLNLVVRNIERTQVLTGLWLEGLALAVALLGVVAVLRMAAGLGYSQNRKILLMVLSFVPLVNLVQLIVLSICTTRLLRAAGWTVGLFGARP